MIRKKTLPHKASKPRMILDKRWDPKDLEAVAMKHYQKPKTFVENLVLNAISAYKEKQLKLFKETTVITTKKTANGKRK